MGGDCREGRVYFEWTTFLDPSCGRVRVVDTVLASLKIDHVSKEPASVGWTNHIDVGRLQEGDVSIWGSDSPMGGGLVVPLVGDVVASSASASSSWGNRMSPPLIWLPTTHVSSQEAAMGEVATPYDGNGSRVPFAMTMRYGVDGGVL